MSETAARFFDGEFAREHEVRVRLDAAGLEIEGLAVPRRVWPLSGLDAASRAQAGHPLRLTHESAPGARLIITSEAFARELAALAPHLGGAMNVRRVARAGGIIGLSVAAAAACLYAVLAFAPGQIAFLLPEDWRIRLGAQIETSFSAGAKLCGSAENNATLRRLGARLAEGNPDAPPFELRVYDIPIINAFALPGGRIIVTKKLIEAAAAPDEVAGVVAHEIGHAQYRHAEAQLIRAMGIDILLRMAAGGGDTVSGLAGMLAILRYSREAERQADAFARATLVNAAIDPLGLARFFETMKKKDGESTTGIFGTIGDIISTHPMTDERIAAITPLPEGVEARPVLGDDDWRALRKICG